MATKLNASIFPISMVFQIPKGWGVWGACATVEERRCLRGVGGDKEERGVSRKVNGKNRVLGGRGSSGGYMRKRGQSARAEMGVSRAERRANELWVGVPSQRSLYKAEPPRNACIVGCAVGEGSSLGGCSSLAATLEPGVV